MKFRGNFGYEFLAVILFVYFDNAESFYTEEVGTPLLLSPLIEAGQIEDARKQAKIEHRDLKDMGSYAGFFTINKTDNNNMFFWYFPAKENPENAPVILHVEGEPSPTFLLRFFMDSGPFQINRDFRIIRRNISWTEFYNVIYVEKPPNRTSNLKYNDHDGHKFSPATIGQDLLDTMLQFFQLFSSLRKNNFFVYGEFLGGKSVLSVCKAIHEYNLVNENDKINLKGLAIAGGFVDPISQLLWGDYFYQMGLIDENGQKHFHELKTSLSRMRNRS